MESLEPALNKILRDEAKAAIPRWRAANARQLGADLNVLKTNGVASTEIQVAEFRKAVDPVYALVQSKLGSDLLDRVQTAASRR